MTLAPVALAAAPRPAIGTGGSGVMGHQNAQEKMNAEDQGTDAPPPPPSPLDVATAQLHAAQNLLDQTVSQLRYNYRNSPAYTAAATALTNAQYDYEDAKKPPLAALAANADYQAALAEKQKSKDALAAARSGNASSDEVTSLASDAMAAGSKVTRMESDALTNDPGVAAAKKRMIDAKAAVDAMDKRFAATLKDEPHYQAVKGVLDDLRKKVRTLSTQPAEQPQQGDANGPPQPGY